MVRVSMGRDRNASSVDAKSKADAETAAAAAAAAVMALAWPRTRKPAPGRVEDATWTKNLASTSQMRSLAHSSWGRSERGRSDHVQGWATVTSTVAVSHSAGSQIRRFTVEYPSSTSFFKLFGPHIGGDTWASTKPHAFSLAAFHLHTSNTY